MNRNLLFQSYRVNGVEELDFLHNSLAGFQEKRPVLFYRVKEQDKLRPDNISSKFYGSPVYWWVIMLVNDISDVKEELYVGQLLRIPSILDIYDFFKRQRRR